MSQASSRAGGRRSVERARQTILAVEDEPDIQELLRFNLERERYEVLIERTGEGALELLQRRPVDLVLLDIMLPGIDGFEVCRRLRSAPKTARLPVILLTARTEEIDIVAGLELGAEDYVTKPFSPRVLLARVRTVLRRERAPGGEDLLRLGELEIDRGKHQVRLNGETIPLTLTEFKLLLQFCSRPGWVFTRNQLLDAVQGPDSYVLDRTVDVHVGSLRRKLGDFGARIETVRGVGYRFGEQP